jgi:hypothetical protein
LGDVEAYRLDQAIRRAAIRDRLAAESLDLMPREKAGES